MDALLLAKKQPNIFAGPKLYLQRLTIDLLLASVFFHPVQKGKKEEETNKILHNTYHIFTLHNGGFETWKRSTLKDIQGE